MKQSVALSPFHCQRSMQHNGGAGRRFLFSMAIALVCLCCLGSQSAEAAAIYLKSEDQPVLGFITSTTATHITIQYWEDGEKKERVIPLNQVDEVLMTVAPDKLARLDPTRPAGYRDYAEELAVKRIDPEAREMAIRLFLISAQYGDAGLRHSALRGLMPLARNPAEKRRFVALAYRYGAIENLGANQQEPHSGSSRRLTDKQREAVVNAIRMARSGNLRRARMIAESSNLEIAFAENELGITHQEFIGAMQGEEVSNENLIRLLVLELSISEPGGLSDDLRQKSRDAWGNLISPGKIDPVTMLDIHSATEFNPAECYYSEGQWLDRKP